LLKIYNKNILQHIGIRPSSWGFLCKIQKEKVPHFGARWGVQPARTAAKRACSQILILGFSVDFELIVRLLKYDHKAKASV
jgi:hypothetical protein